VGARAADEDRAAAAYRAAVARDPATTQVERELLAADAHRFVPRRRILRFVSQHLDEIREQAAVGQRKETELPRRIWVYWAQGMQSAPAVVRRCQEELLRLHTNEEVVVLDDSLVPHYVDVPPIVLERTQHDKTKFSDVLRLELLARYGGIWMDATCLPRQRVFEPVVDLLASGFFAFRYRSARISSWLLASEPNHPIVALLREAQYVYWEQHRRPLDYYLIHHLFEALYYLDEGFRAGYDATPNVSSDVPSRFARMMHEPYDPEAYEAMMNACWVHKLSNRSPAAQLSAGSHLAHFVRGDAPR
jgi:hypothetical protein